MEKRRVSGNNLRSFCAKPEGLQLHNIKRFSLKKTAWARRVVKSDCSWTQFAKQYKIDKCKIYGDRYMENVLGITDNIWARGNRINERL